MSYYVAEVEALRERVTVIKDELAQHATQESNRTLYALTVLSGLILPISFITGLLGINVGGLPLVDNDKGFHYVCAILAGVLMIEVIFFRFLAAIFSRL